MTDAKQRFKHQQEWMKALASSNERLTQKVIGNRLALYLNMKSGRLNPSYSGIARNVGMSKRTVIRSIAILEAAGWIENNHAPGGRKAGGKRGQTNSFALLDPPQPTDLKGDAQMSPLATISATIKGVKFSTFKGDKNPDFGPVKGDTAVSPEHTNRRTSEGAPGGGANNAAPNGAAARAPSPSPPRVAPRENGSAGDEQAQLDALAGAFAGTEFGEFVQEQPRPRRRPRHPKDDWPADYRQQFWDAYPNRVGQKPALAALGRLRHKQSKPAWNDIMDGLDRYVAFLRSYGQHDRKPLNPHTWITEERWNDEPR